MLELRSLGLLYDLSFIFYVYSLVVTFVLVGHYLYVLTEVNFSLLTPVQLSEVLGFVSKDKGLQGRGLSPFIILFPLIGSKTFLGV